MLKEVWGLLGVVGPAMVWLTPVLKHVGPDYEGELAGCWGRFGQGKPWNRYLCFE
jgi:hypothetical protein